MAKTRNKTAKNKSAPKGRRAAPLIGARAAPGHPDQRLPVHNDPDHEILCKWIDNAYQCRQVPTGGDWNP